MTDIPETRYSLIQRVKNLDDGASWVEFLGIYQPVVYRMARRRGMQDADAQDTVQQVFASIARAIDRWTARVDQPPFRAWLTTIARNAITTALSRQPVDRATGSSSVVQLLHQQPTNDQTKAELVIESHQEMVRWAAAQIRSEFTEQTWDIFWKTSIDQIPVAKMAELTGRSTGAIYVARHRVLVRLREKIADVSILWDPKEKAR